MPSRSTLEKLSQEHERELKKELELVASKTVSLASNALWIVGGLAITYTLFKALSSDESPKGKKTSPKSVDKNQTKGNDSKFSLITSELTKAASLFLLGIAKEKLDEYLNSGHEPVKRN